MTKPRLSFVLGGLVIGLAAIAWLYADAASGGAARRGKGLGLA
jgi:hypothetical protein